MKMLHLLPVLSLFLFLGNAKAQLAGCTDPLATNYNASATVNNGSCVYSAASVAPATSINLSANVLETSGLIRWDNYVWTHNDNTDINIYALDTINGNILQTHPLTGIVNTDWEEISQDAAYVYMGDFGNNANGNRTDLKIYKIAKSTILANAPVVETINFSYQDQTSFAPTGANNTNFDCEAFVVSADSIFLFTKQWVSKKTSVYSLPKTPGTYIAKLKATYNVQGLITGASYLQDRNLIALSGYSITIFIQPFAWLLYDFNGTDFFGGNKRKISISLLNHQVEGIATTDGLKYYLSNESLVQLPYVNIPQKLHVLDLSSYLSTYLTGFSLLTWNGSVSNDWNTPANWTPNAKPKATNDVSVPNVAPAPVINESAASPAQCRNMAVQPGAVVGIASGKALTVNGNLSNYAGNGGLLIESDGSLIVNGSVNGTATINHTFADNKWHFLSTPVYTATFGGVFANSMTVWARSWEPAANAWQYKTGSQPFVVGKGYSVGTSVPPVTAIFTGSPNNQPVTSILSNANGGWNLLGNPFQSAINWSLVVNPDVAATVYVWNGSNYIFYNANTQIGSLANGIIPALNGFFVSTALNGSSVTVPLTARVHDTHGFYKKSNANLLELLVKGDDASDGMFIHFGNSGSSAFDDKYDAIKRWGEDYAPQLFSISNGEFLSINDLPLAGNEIVNVGFKCSANGKYQINASGMESFAASVPIWLEDVKLNSFHDLRVNPVYTFGYEATDNELRFKLHFADVPTTEILSANIYYDKSNVIVSMNGRETGEIYIYNITGQLMASKSASQGNNLISLGLPGTYIVKVVTEKNSVVKKIIIP